MSGWERYDGTQHYRWCNDCGANAAFGNHTGGTATCSAYAVCEVCHCEYGAYNRNAHGDNFTDWEYYDGVQHYRYCQDCGEGKEYGDHTGGTATCFVRAYCEVCQNYYGGLSDVHTLMFDWTNYDDTQHYRWCACGAASSYEYAEHYGGTATCGAHVFCEGCGAPYGEKPSTHTGPFTEWTHYTTSLHSRMCEVCGDSEFGDHTGGTATCASPAICEVCHEKYGTIASTHTGKLSSEYVNVDFHYTTCDLCTFTWAEYHTGGTATCTEDGLCEVCEAAYIPATEHNWGKWESNSDGTHTRVCLNDATHTESDACTGGAATCTEDGVCEVCEAAYIPATKHGWGAWQSGGDGTHTRVCLNDATHTESDACTGGKATCTDDGVCEVCDAAYIPATKHSWGEWESNGDGTHTRVCMNDVTHTESDACTGGTATCTDDGVCEVCDAAYIPATKHSWGEWESNGDGTHTRVCRNDATHTESDACTGGTATCTTKAVCKACASEHGAALGHIPSSEANCTTDQICTREGCGEVLTDKISHDYAAVVTKPTCTKPGCTTYTCARCEDSYQSDLTAARGHWYDPWHPNQDGTHSATCKRYGCAYEGTAECTLYEVTVKDGENETVLTVCPICGAHEEVSFGVANGAAIKAMFIHQLLPRGEQIVRELDMPFDGALYAFTVAYESAGRVEPFIGKVSVSLSLDAELYAEFKLVRVDVTLATEETERTEVWTDIAFTFANDRLTFETNVAGLFLLVPIE